MTDKVVSLADHKAKKNSKANDEKLASIEKSLSTALRQLEHIKKDLDAATERVNFIQTQYKNYVDAVNSNPHKSS